MPNVLPDTAIPQTKFNQNPLDPMESLALSMASIAQSFREYVELCRRETNKNQPARLVKIGTAKFTRQEAEADEVPGFRRTKSTPANKT